MSTATDEPIHNVHESLFHWDGWSLVASRPGLAVGPLLGGGGGGVAGAPPQDGAVTPTSAGAGLGFTSTIVPQPGSLPKLRFGTSYQFRCRAVDLCGNDMRIATPGAPKTTRRRPSASCATSRSRRRCSSSASRSPRRERRAPRHPQRPVRNAAGQRGRVGSGGGKPQRGDGDEPLLRDVRAAHRSAQGVGAARRVPRRGRRGDREPRAAARPQAAWAIVSKEDGGFYDRFVTDSTTGNYRTAEQVGRSIVTAALRCAERGAAIASGQPAFTGNQDITPRGTALQSGQYVVFDTDSILLPYLPDPNASGLTVQGLGANPVYAPTAARDQPRGRAWPELATFRVVLNERRRRSRGRASMPRPRRHPARRRCRCRRPRSRSSDIAAW